MSAIGGRGKADIFKVHGFSTDTLFESVHFSHQMSRIAIRTLNQKVNLLLDLKEKMVGAVGIEPTTSPV
jgi:hypothetical protein